MNASAECLICKAPLEYLTVEVEMECCICHKKEMSRTRCINGHYVCSECHTTGLTDIIGYCLTETSTDPIEIIRKMMAMPFCHMHGPEHHVMVGSALLTAYRNAGGEIDLSAALLEMQKRGKCVPGGACGFWGFIQPDDGILTEGYRRSRRASMLQARLVPRHTLGNRFRKDASGNRNDQT